MRYLRRIGIAVVIGIVVYFLCLNLFQGLKAKGYSSFFKKASPYDLVIKHALIIDGTGTTEEFRGDVAIKDGKITGVGIIEPEGSTVFDAGGLTVVPVPLPIEKSAPNLEHVFKTCYPLYPAQNIYLQEGLHQGLNLEQAAAVMGNTVEEAFHILQKSPEVNPKALLADIPYNNGTNTLHEKLAYLTGYRAMYYDKKDQGVIKIDAAANMYIFQNKDYTDEDLIKLFQQGKVPDPVIVIKDGKYIQ